MDVKFYPYVVLKGPSFFNEDQALIRRRGVKMAIWLLRTQSAILAFAKFTTIKVIVNLTFTSKLYILR